MFAQIGYYICVPFAWLTRLFYSLTGSYGLALILFTLVVKLVILPFQLKSKKSMLRMNRMQGKVKDIQTRFANNRERQQQEMAELYAREGVNPMSGCLWSFIPFPIQSLITTKTSPAVHPSDSGHRWPSCRRRRERPRREERKRADSGAGRRTRGRARR